MFPISQNGRILPNKLHFEKLIPLSFCQLREEQDLVFSVELHLGLIP